MDRNEFIKLMEIVAPGISSLPEEVIEKLYNEKEVIDGLEGAKRELKILEGLRAIKGGPKVSTYVHQWKVPGSRGNVYTVSKRGDGEFECSCPAWTRTTPRRDCKHIKLVKTGAFESLPASEAKEEDVNVNVEDPLARMIEEVKGIFADGTSVAVNPAEGTAKVIKKAPVDIFKAISGNAQWRV